MGVEKGLVASSELINKFSLSKCSDSFAGKPSGEKTSPNKFSLANISKAPAK